MLQKRKRKAGDESSATNSVKKPKFESRKVKKPVKDEPHESGEKSFNKQPKLENRRVKTPEDDKPYESGEKSSVKRLKIENKKAKNPVENVSYEPQWSTHELLAEQLNLDLNVSKNLIELFDDGNTVPFIARYRRDVTDNLEAEQLRLAKETCDEINALKSKIATALKKLEKLNVLNEQVKQSVVNSRSFEELEYVVCYLFTYFLVFQVFFSVRTVQIWK